MGCLESRRASAMADSTSSTSSDFRDSYKLGSLLGQGSYAQVRQAHELSTGHQRAVKIMKIEPGSGGAGEFFARAAVREMLVWVQIGSHRNCVSLIQSFVECGASYMVMEQCCCSLWDMLSTCLKRHGAIPFKVEALPGLFHDMMSGVAHLHALQIAHRDVKPENFLFSDSDGTLKLADFGLAASVAHGPLQGVFGTAPYMAPEMLCGLQYNEAIDIWSVGAVYFLMISGDFPYMPPEMTPQAMKNAIRQNTPELNLSKVSGSVCGAASAANLLEELLRREPNLRMNAAAALHHGFMHSISAN
eukprot:TRINITY_DN43018_c0_g1_i1.p1 TRINITY_DN43018_c0_g1~~TRINITY_DN43018_c0_g1_i1.p1  ORF type:complete len:303 (-),score=37.38 TRINITY_DN43018_c0_g1_i1:18-926(-)